MPGLTSRARPTLEVKACVRFLGLSVGLQYYLEIWRLPIGDILEQSRHFSEGNSLVTSTLSEYTQR